MSWEPTTGGERFELRKRLGEGSFGVVFEAWDRERESRVALKALKTADAFALYNLKREFRTLANISHPNLVNLYELVSDGDQWYITMELVEGENFFYYVRGELQAAAPDSTEETVAYSQTIALSRTEEDATAVAIRTPEGDEASTKHEIKAPRTLPLPREAMDRLRGAVRSLAEGLVALHSAGIIHRDVKPSNVLVSADGHVTVLDFGLVREHDPHDVVASQHIAGTPAYMAPEQAAGQPVSEACDWFAVGIMLWEALVGFRPERGGDSMRPIAPPSVLVPGVPEDLDLLCQKLVKRNPAERLRGENVLRHLGPAPDVESPQVLVRGARSSLETFVGRVDHLQRLAGAFQRTEKGDSAVALVHGSSGMGKTALVLQFLSQLEKQRPDVVVLRGRCYERESVPYKAVDSLVDSLAVYLSALPRERVEGLLPKDVLALARLFPVLRRVGAVADARRRFVEISDSRELRRRAFAALRDLLARLSEREATVLFIDDLHWGDADSAALLLDVLRPPDAPPLLLIGTYRTEEVETSPALQAFLAVEQVSDERSIFEVEVGEFTVEEGRELAAALVDDSDERLRGRAEAFVREAGGSPFFLEKLITVATDGSDKERHSDTSTQEGLSRVLTDMVADLDSVTQRLLEILAVRGRPTPLGVATEAADIAQEILPLLKGIEAARLVRIRETQRGEEIEIYHDRIRIAVIESLPGERLTEHHRRLFAALSASGTAEAEALAVHAEGGGDLAGAAHYFAVAGTEASRALAFGTAADLYQRALDLREEGDTDVRRLRIEMGHALVNAGRGANAAAAFLSAAEGSDSAEALELRRRAAQHLLMSGHLDEGLESIRTVLEAQGLSLPSTPRRALLSVALNRLRMRVQGLGYKDRPSSEVPEAERRLIDTCWAATGGLIMINTIYALDFQGRGLWRALRAGDSMRVARSLAFEQLSSASSGSHARKRTDEIERAAAAAAKSANHPFATAISTLYAGCSNALNGEWRKAVEVSDRAESILRERCTGVAYELDLAHVFALFGLSWLGEYRRLEKRLRPLLRDAEERNDLLLVTYLKTEIAPRVLLAIDRPEEAEAEALEGIGRWPYPGFHRQHQYALRSRADIHLYRGQGTAAWDLIESQYADLQHSLILKTQLNRIVASDYRGRSALAASFEAQSASDAARLRAVAESEAQNLHREKAFWGEPMSLLLQASLALSADDTGSAQALLAGAEAGFESSEMRLHAAVSRIRRGAMMGGRNGSQLIEEAKTWMHDEGFLRPDCWVRMLSPIGDHDEAAEANCAPLEAAS